ncbi:hypothetical protein STEG23_013222, partial [Scotinomys teguina]
GAGGQEAMAPCQLSRPGSKKMELTLRGKGEEQNDCQHIQKAFKCKAADHPQEDVFPDKSCPHDEHLCIQHSVIWCDTEQCGVPLIPWYKAQPGILMQREDVILEWIFLPHKPNKKLKTYIEKISDLIHKVPDSFPWYSRQIGAFLASEPRDGEYELILGMANSVGQPPIPSLDSRFLKALATPMVQKLLPQNPLSFGKTTIT